MTVELTQDPGTTDRHPQVYAFDIYIFSSSFLTLYECNMASSSSPTENEVAALVKAYVEQKDGKTAMKIPPMPADKYIAGFESILDAFLKTDFRQTPGKHIKSANFFFVGISTNAEAIVPAHAEKLSRLLQWFAVQLRTDTAELNGIAQAANTILCALAGLLRGSYASNGNDDTTVLPGVLACLSLGKHSSVVNSASSVVNIIARGNKDAVVDRAEDILMALEYGVNGDAAMSLLVTLDHAYTKAMEPIHRHIDTIAEYTVLNTYTAIGGTLLLQKVAKRCPRLLYAFVDDFVPLLKDQSVGTMVLQMLSDIAARNALIFVPHLDQLMTATEETGLQTGCGVSLMGYIGRTQPEIAAKVVERFMEWIENDIDPQANHLIIEQLRNVGGVYKSTLSPYIETLRKLASHSDSSVKDAAEKLVHYYDGDEHYLSTAFLVNQEDIYGRLIEVVNQTVDAKALSMNKNIQEISRRVDHQEERTKDLDEKHYVVADLVNSTTQKINAVELAAKQQEKRLEAVETSIEDLEKELKEKDSEIKSFIAEFSKALPIPTSVEAKGKIRKRILLRFECAQGRKPDFVMETASWTKWLRVIASSISTGYHIAVGDVGASLKGLLDVFKAMRRKDADPNLKFDTLVQQPFLTSTEQDELILGLRQQGFFEEFEYNSTTAKWERKLLVPQEPVEAEPDESKVQEDVAKENIEGGLSAKTEETFTGEEAVVEEEPTEASEDEFSKRTFSFDFAVQTVKKILNKSLPQHKYSRYPSGFSKALLQKLSIEDRLKGGEGQPRPRTSNGAAVMQFFRGEGQALDHVTFAAIHSEFEANANAL